MVKKKNKNTQDNGEVKFYSKEIKKESESTNNIKLLIGFIVLVAIISLLVYLLFYINAKYVTKDKYQDETTTTTTTAIYDNTKTTVSEMFKITDKHYYVFAYDPDDTVNGSYYRQLVNRYSGDVNVYTLDYTISMNSKYYDPNSTENTSPKNASEVMITKPAILEFKNGKVVNYITDKDTIIQTLS